VITCHLRYFIEPDKVEAFKDYARVWMRLIEKYGGTHHGYFLQDDTPASANFSFPGIGEEGPTNVAVALFSFPDLATYEKYRREVREDPECRTATSRYEQTQCFKKYERTFLKPIERDPRSQRR
jgi:hypothetical protein